MEASTDSGAKPVEGNGCQLHDRLQTIIETERNPAVSELLENTVTASWWGEETQRYGQEGIAQLIAGILPHQGVVVVCGPSTVGKSWLAMDLAARIVAWSDFAGLPVQKLEDTHTAGFALHVAAEDNDGIRERAAAWSIAGHAGPPNRLVLMSGLSLHLPRDTGALTTAIHHVSSNFYHHKYRYERCAIVVVDHLTALAAGDTLDSDSTAEGLMRSLHQIAGDCACPVIAIHHTGRDGTRFRGSQVLFDRADAWWSVRLGRNCERLVHIDKMRNGPRSVGFSFRLVPAELKVPTDNPEASPISTLFLEHLGELSADGDAIDVRKLSRRCQQALACLPSHPVTEGAARKLFEDAAILSGTADARRVAFRRLLADLTNAGAITRPDNLIHAVSGSASLPAN